MTDTTEKPSILLIDDSILDLRLLLERLASRAHVAVAFNGRDGYDKAVLALPDLILLDVSMPVMDGYATCRMLKCNERTRHIPVIFLSASNDVERRIEGLALGAVDFISKPFHELEVIARVGIHLNLRPRQARSDSALAPGDAALNPAAPQRESALAGAAMAYLREHLSSPPAPDALARLFGTNEKRLNQAFQSSLGMPVFAWLREERLRQARALLASTQTPVSAIGDHLGYSSPANFSKAFRERFGCSPRQLRTDLQGSQPLAPPV